MKFKTFLINALGVFTTVLAVVVIYIILWLESIVGPPDASTYTEFGIITFLAVYTKIFWYKSVENSVRTTEQYLKDKKDFTDEIDSVVTNINSFDKFIANENIANYNRYMDSKCRLLSIDNYKITFRDKLWCLFHFKKVKSVPKQYFIRKHVLRCERHGLKLNQLSAARITSSTSCEFVDDRNFAKRDKARHIAFGTIVSTMMFALFASMAFKAKEDINVAETVAKMIMYLTSITMNIATTILTAKITTLKDDYDYFRRIYNILDRYAEYLENPVIIERVKYIEILNISQFEEPYYPVLSAETLKPKLSDDIEITPFYQIEEVPSGSEQPNNTASEKQL